MARRLPRLLVTGFNAFPGAPTNPTELLVAELGRQLPRIEPLADFRADVIDVDYRAVPKRLADIGKAFRPDIAIHFGLANEARGFRLERLAWNRASLRHPDNSGYIPEAVQFCAGAESLESALPLAEIHAALTAAGLPVEYSDSAGEYLCNYLFYWSRAGLAKGFKPKMTGFIHVPLLAEGARPAHHLKRRADGGETPPLRSALSLDQLISGALLIVETCCAVWRQRKSPASLPGSVSVGS